MTLSDAMGILRSTSDQTHKFWTYFQLVTASAMTLAWGATTQVHVVFGLVLGYALFAYLNGLLVNSSQTDARKIWTSIQAYVADMPGEVPEKWPRLSEQHSPIFKWTPCGLPTVQRCPRRRASLATNDRRGGHLGAHQGSSSYAASFRPGRPAKYASSGVSRFKLE